MSSEADILDHLVTAELKHLLNESLRKLRHCVNQLSDDQVWQRPAPSMNSVGNLLLHISGNLRQWAICGVTGAKDKRDRDAEFACTSGESSEELLVLVENTVRDAVHVFDALDAAALSEPRQIQGFEVTVLSALFHTVTHFVGHSHQIVQLTRLLLGENYRFEWTPESPRGGVPI
ncbi:MAG: DinB family protein [Planctomycetota bacterium]